VSLVDVELGADSGFDVAEQLLRAAPAAPPPVILISTHAAEDFADLIESSPATGFVAKSELSAGAIHDLLSRRDADTNAHR
jgi:DNA-binding NarL/FixJ family response regulator